MKKFNYKYAKGYSGVGKDKREAACCLRSEIKDCSYEDSKRILEEETEINGDMYFAEFNDDDWLIVYKNKELWRTLVLV